MEFKLNSTVEFINKINGYLTNACEVYSSEMATSARGVRKCQEEQKLAERRISEDCEDKVKAAASKAQSNIDADSDRKKKLEELNNKLKLVDKKYQKCESTIVFAGITDELRQELISIVNGEEEIDYRMVEKIYQFFKRESYQYIAKPVSPILPLTKKRKHTYELLAACTIIISDYIKLNTQYFTDIRDEEIKQIKEDAAQEALALKKKNEAQLSALLQGANKDKEFLLSESKKIFSDMFSEDFYTSYRAIRERVKSCFSSINEDDEFNNEIYIGDVAYALDDAIIRNEIGESLIKANPNLFEDGVVFLPWTVQLSNCQSVFVTPASFSDKESVVTWINQYIYSFIRQLPLNGLELTIFDPDRRGNSIFPFLNLPTILPEMFSRKIYTSTEDIASRIQELNQYVDSVIQQKLSNRFKDVFEYNAATPDNPLPIKLVCIFDFPKFFDGRSFEYLISIIKNAQRCGIFVVIGFNPNEQNNGYGDNSSIIQAIKKESISLIQSKGMLVVERTNLGVLSTELPSQSVIDEYCTEYQQAWKKKMSKGIPFLSVVKEGNFFTKKSAESISLPVGKGDGSVTQFIDFGKRSSQHAIITGATGSGKSTLLHTLIMSAIINYSPDELNLYLMDFKSGTEFKIYETIQVPHIKLLALDALQEFGESILVELVEEQNRRSQLFKDSGEHTNLKSYVAATGQTMPRILVIMDEFQILFNESGNRKVAMHCAELANKIVTEGRAFGIHLVMATQTLRSIREKTALSNSTIEQMRIRIGLKCGEEDASYIFGDTNARDALMKMKGAIGTAVYNPEYTEANNSGFRVAYCSEIEQKGLLTSIANACKNDYICETKVFEGKRVPEYPAMLVDKYKQSKDTEIMLQIGEPIKIDNPISITFNKKKNNNLLVIGTDANLMSRIVSNVSLGILLSNNTKLHYFDGNSFFDEPIDSYLSELFDHYKRVELISNRKDCLLCIEELYEEFKSRRKGISNLSEKHFVVINGLQYIDVLTMALKGDIVNRDDYIENDNSTTDIDIDINDDLDMSGFDDIGDSFDYSTAIKELIELGYAYGIYFVLASNDYQTIREVLHYGAGLLNKLSNRIVFAINDKDSDELIDGIQVSGMNDVTAVYTDGIKRTMQFKPYSLPSISELK